jgi:hypothetical protein
MEKPSVGGLLILTVGGVQTQAAYGTQIRIDLIVGCRKTLG